MNRRSFLGVAGATSALALTNPMKLLAKPKPAKAWSMLNGYKDIIAICANNEVAEHAKRQIMRNTNILVHSWEAGINPCLKGYTVVRELFPERSICAFIDRGEFLKLYRRIKYEDHSTVYQSTNGLFNIADLVISVRDNYETIVIKDRHRPTTTVITQNGRLKKIVSLAV